MFLMFSRHDARARRRAPGPHTPHGSQFGKAAVEALEGRTLLAGNVIATQIGTTLLLEGDLADNEIQVRSGNSPTEVIVNGLNQTLVDGSSQEVHFFGVRQITGSFDGGNDVFEARNLSLSPETIDSLSVDGGTGDDRITVFGTSVDATVPADTLQNQVSMVLAGDQVTAETGPSTGNDFIEVSNTTLVADGGEMADAVLRIAGDVNVGGTITGGNDHINVSNTTIRATNASIEGAATAAVQIFGDLSVVDATSGPATIGEGNDWIDVNGTNIIADNAQGSSAVLVQIIGERNDVFGGSAAVGDVAAKTGGDDTISLTNTSLSTTSGSLVGSAFVEIQGEQNISRGFGADVGGGNDTISVDNLSINASGTNSDHSADLRIFGDGNLVGQGVNLTSRVGIGNDAISIANVDVTATGTLNNAATVLIFSDDQTEGGEAGSTVGQGDDDVRLNNFLLESQLVPPGTSSSNIQLHTRKGDDFVDIRNSAFTGLGLSTGSGDDELDILASNWVSGNLDLEDGNDVLKMNNNTFVNTDADGGLGFDVLLAHGNAGVITAVNFEQVNGMPSPPLIVITG